MAFKVKILLHSLSPFDKELLTWRLTFPRCILAEVNTHTVLGKNAASSRAIPTKRLIEQVETDPYIPLEWGRNRDGMQANEVLNENQSTHARVNWLIARDWGVFYAKELSKLGSHKQDVNRLIEPWMWTTQVLTGTEWANFFALRTHQTAHPTFRFLARAMYVAYQKSTAQRLELQDWHLPFITPEDFITAHTIAKDWNQDTNNLYPESLKCLSPFMQNWTWRNAKKNLILAVWSASRCARVSYDNLDGTKPTPSGDFALFEKLVYRPAGSDVPLHTSPLWHQATPVNPTLTENNKKYRSHLNGWLPFRRLLPGETVQEFSVPENTLKEWESVIPPEVFE